MIPTDVGAHLKHAISVRPDEYTASVNGVSFDRMPAGEQRYESALLYGEVGDIEGAPTSFTVDYKLQDSADDTTFADVTGETLTQVTAANTSRSKAVNLVGLRRYVRVVGTVSFTGGTTPNAACSAGFAALGLKRNV